MKFASRKVGIRSHACRAAQESGLQLPQRKKYVFAEKQLKIATSLEPGDPFAHYYLARLYLATARDREAVEELEPSRQLLKNDPEASFEMAQACLRLNQTKAALLLISALEQRSDLSTLQDY